MRLIDVDKIVGNWMLAKFTEYNGRMCLIKTRRLQDVPEIDPDSIRPKGLYTAHEVAEIIADLFGDTCACNFNGIDEWLPERCELQDACPHPVGVACWEQYLKHREAKMEE